MNEAGYAHARQAVVGAAVAIAREEAELVARMREVLWEMSENPAHNLHGDAAELLEAIASRLSSLEEERRRRFVRDQELDDWLTEQVHRGEGVLTLGLTENGTVGLWLPESRFPESTCDGWGDSALEALQTAHDKHVTPAPNVGGAALSLGATR